MLEAGLHAISEDFVDFLDLDSPQPRSCAVIDVCEASNEAERLSISGSRPISETEAMTHHRPKLHRIWILPLGLKIARARSGSKVSQSR